MFGFIAADGGVAAGLEKARAARDVLIHCGSDQAGEWHDGYAYVGHRRLSIIYTSEGGLQSMVSDDGAVVIAANGEIYYFRALRAELEAVGAASGSDSEVILHGYRRWASKRCSQRSKACMPSASTMPRRNCSISCVTGPASSRYITADTAEC